MPWTPETAKAAQQKSVEVRRRKKELSPEERVKASAAEVSAIMMKDLIAAARGTGDFEGLDINKRVECMKTVLAYGIGRPSAGTKSAPEADSPEVDEDTPLV